jgi:hypothetical protein
MIFLILLKKRILKGEKGMKELIGRCSCCGKELFCLDGFFNGVYTDEKKIVCFDCENAMKEENPQS